MPNQVSAYAIYNGATNTFLGSNAPLIALNCTDFAAFTPIFGYLKRKIEMGVAGGTIIEYSPTFDANDPEIDANTLRGVFIQQNEGLIMIDAVSVQNVVDTCDGCCGTTNTVTRYYTSGIPTNAPFTSPTTSTYTVTRTDAGTPGAIDIFSMDYMDQVVTDPIHVSWASGTSVYRITAFGMPQAVGTDVVT